MRLGRRPWDSSLLEDPPAALREIERFRNELGGEEPNRAKPSVTKLETSGHALVAYTFGYRKHSLGATRIDLTRQRQIGKGPVTPIRATVAPFPAWRGSRFRVDRATRDVASERELDVFGGRVERDFEVVERLSRPSGQSARF